MPGSPRSRSLKPRRPRSKSRTIRSDQRSPTTSSALATGQYWPYVFTLSTLPHRSRRGQYWIRTDFASGHRPPSTGGEGAGGRNPERDLLDDDGARHHRPVHAAEVREGPGLRKRMAERDAASRAGIPGAVRSACAGAGPRRRGVREGRVSHPPDRVADGDRRRVRAAHAVDERHGAPGAHVHGASRADGRRRESGPDRAGVGAGGAGVTVGAPGGVGVSVGCGPTMVSSSLHAPLAKTAIATTARIRNFLIMKHLRGWKGTHTSLLRGTQAKCHGRKKDDRIHAAFIHATLSRRLDAVNELSYAVREELE